MGFSAEDRLRKGIEEIVERLRLEVRVCHGENEDQEICDLFGCNHLARIADELEAILKRRPEIGLQSHTSTAPGELTFLSILAGSSVSKEPRP